MKKFPHSVNGRFYGNFVYMPDGRALYLAHRKRREIFNARHAWCLDLSTLNKIKDRGIDTVGVVVRTGSENHFWITPVDDFFGPHSFSHMGDTRQRGLPLNRFKLNPGLIERIIKKSIKVR